MGLPRAHVFSRLMVLCPCSHVCAQQVHVRVCATGTCVFAFVGAWPMFTRLCTAGAWFCVCVCVCATSACISTFVGAWPMFTRLCTAGAWFCMCVCATSTCVSTFVGAWPMFTRLCTAGACSCVCHEHMRCSVCGCLAHVHTFVHGRCMFLFVFKEHL